MRFRESERQGLRDREIAALLDEHQKGKSDRVGGGEVHEADGDNRIIDGEVGEEAVH